MSSAHIKIHPAHPDSLSAQGKTLKQTPHYLTLVAANGQVLATSEMYDDKDNAETAVTDWLLAMSQVVDAARAERSVAQDDAGQTP